MQANYRRIFHLLAGPLLAVVLFGGLPLTFTVASGATITLDPAARWTVACIAWMAWWWLAEPLPLPVTSLIPALFFPLLGVQSLQQTLIPYADPLLFLFFGGFVLAAAIEKWNLHRRFAFSLLRLSGGRTHRLVLAIMVATAFISLWLSNTATAVLMFPVALSLARHELASENLRKCLVLAVAYGATIGGIGTLIGTPPNIFAASFLHSQYHLTLDFWTWLGFGMPMVVTMLPFTYWMLTRVCFPLGELRLGLFTDDGPELSWRWSQLPPAARVTLGVFLGAVVAWMSRAAMVELELGGHRPLRALTDTGIALAAALTLFVLPLRGGHSPALTWEDTRSLPWGTLLLFGGGLSLAAAISANHIDTALGALLAGIPAYPKPVVIAAIAASVIFVSEIASNIATAAAMIPLLAAAAPALGLSPASATIVAGLAASSAYMLPVGTAPNALAYGSGFLSTRDMARAGLALNVFSIALIVLVGLYLVPELS